MVLDRQIDKKNKWNNRGIVIRERMGCVNYIALYIFFLGVHIGKMGGNFKDWISTKKKEKKKRKKIDNGKKMGK